MPQEGVVPSSQLGSRVGTVSHVSRSTHTQQPSLATATPSSPHSGLTISQKASGSVGQPCGTQAATQSSHMGHEDDPHQSHQSSTGQPTSPSQPGSPQGLHVAGLTQT